VKAAGDGGMIACGEKIAAMLLNNGLADEMVVIMLLVWHDD
jgi:dihydrofolate reductase